MTLVARWSHRQDMSKGEKVTQSLEGFLLSCVATDTYGAHNGKGATLPIDTHTSTSP